MQTGLPIGIGHLHIVRLPATTTAGRGLCIGVVAVATQTLLTKVALATGDVERHQNRVTEFRFSTSGPTSSTTPVNSWPKVMPIRMSATRPL